MQPNRSSSWHTVVQTIADAWLNWRGRRQDLVGLNHVDATEVSEVARELGVSPTELRTLVGRGRNSAELLQRRLEVLGIAPSSIEPGVMRDLQRCCSNCGEKSLCAHEIEDKPKEATWPRYCPNEQTIQALQTEQLNKGRVEGDSP